MRMLLNLIAILLLASPLALVASLCQDTPAQSDDPVAQLIEQLGADTFEEREAAFKDLLTIGHGALDQLRTASREHKDPEVRFRADRAGAAIVLSLAESRSTGMQFRAVMPDQFLMGSHEEENARRHDELRHRVQLTRPFLMGIHEVTQDQFQQVMGYNPSWFQADGEGHAKVADLDLKLLPVEQVSWFDAIEFCNQLSLKDGFEPFYDLTDIERDKNSIRTAQVAIRGGDGYRLPTEAEWEFACRAGGVTPFHFGVSKGYGQFSNVKGVTRHIGYGQAIEAVNLARTNLVGSYDPNAWGLFDMHGNVGEWCWDWYAPEYEQNQRTRDPLGPDQGDQRCVRGGSWLMFEDNSRCAARSMQAPNTSSYVTGFRIVRGW